ncbi:RNA polymerase sigma factor [Myxococcus hansupus]|nr:sigma-70 family RNA polymerase sigma factor [Myxococcus hansupus]
MIPQSHEETAFEDLLQRARAGEQEAMDALFRRSWKALERHASKSPALGLQGATRPSDIFQDSALRAFEKLASFRGNSEGEWVTWLKQVVFSQSIDIVRVEAGQAKYVPGGRVPEGEASESLPSQERTPSQVTAHHEDWHRLLSKFTLLTPDQQKAISLFWFDELSVEEAAQRMGKSHTSVSSLLQRGMSTLRREMRSDASSSQDDAEVSAALAAYFRKRGAGASPDMEAFIAEYPSCADGLRDALNSVLRLRALKPATRS